MNIIVLATRSAGKLRELRPFLAARGILAIDLVEAGVPETAEEDRLEIFHTFEDNALAKARYFHGQTEKPTVADDSGLSVDALGGQPGVLSKRWSGRTDLSGQALDDENNRLLLERLAATGTEDAAAHYVCAAAYVDDQRELVCRGEVHGRILRVPRGLGGFGYDPHFSSDELGGRSFGEARVREKENISHRARAFQSLLDTLATT